ncbi:MAG: TlpA disulfide reductase family protein [Pelobacteraceae bacterium]
MAATMTFSLKGRNLFRPIVLLVIFVSVTLCSCFAHNNKPEVTVGANSPRISGTDIYGEYVSPGQLDGKVIVLYFWKRSSGGGSLKQLELFFRHNERNNLEILAINDSDSKSDLESYAKNNSITFMMLKDGRSRLVKQFQVLDFPTIFILDRNGIIREKIIGEISIDTLRKLISKQLLIQKT